MLLNIEKCGDTDDRAHLIKHSSRILIHLSAFAIEQLCLTQIHMNENI